MGTEDVWKNLAYSEGRRLKNAFAFLDENVCVCYNRSENA